MHFFDEIGEIRNLIVVVLTLAVILATFLDKLSPEQFLGSAFLIAIGFVFNKLSNGNEKKPQ